MTEPQADFEHGVQGYGYRKCRCEVCRAANTARNMRGRMERYARAAAGDEAVPHGRGGYTNWGCRCEVCTKANSVACGKYRRTRRGQVAT